MKRLAIFMLSFLTVGGLRASCGLSICDVHHPSDVSRWKAETRVSRVAYDLEGLKGSYVQTAVAAEYAGFPSWLLGGTASMVSNSPEEGHHKTGLGNPVLRGERSFGPWAAGALVELPLGDDEHGLAGDHVAAIPYGAWRGALGGWRLDLRAGYSHSFTGGEEEHGGGDDEHAHGLVVNPHEDEEFVYRAVLGQRFGKTELGFQLEGQHALDGETKGKGFLTAGVSADVPWRNGWSVGLLAEGPVARPHRFESRFGARVTKGF